MILLEARDLAKRFNLEAGFFARFGKFVRAVNGVSLSIGEDEAYGLVGESGCGKSTTARLLVRMYEADAGAVRFWPRGAELGKMADDGSVDVRALGRRALAAYRSRVKYVFQDPARSLDPRMSVADVLLSGYRWSPSWPGRALALAEAAAILEEVGLSASDLERRPPEFSGGQRQRISIARALLLRPDLLICDEVVSALDVSVQGQILNLLIETRRRRKLSILFIAHDLKVACYFCDRIGVMYKGEMMEEAPARDLWKAALHPYTRFLFASAPGMDPSAGNERAAGGAVTAASPEPRTDAWEGCAYAARCPLADDRCRSQRPEFREIAPAYRVRCHKADAGE